MYLPENLKGRKVVEERPASKRKLSATSQGASRLNFRPISQTLPTVKAFTVSNSKPLWISGIFLVLANLIPLVGALRFDWNILDIVAVYWAENLILGGFSALRILTAGGLSLSSFGPRLILIGFFLVHYGIFTLVHGVFVFSLLGDEREISNPLEAWDMLTTGTLGWALIALIVSHGFSYVRNFMIRGEFRRTAAPLEMIAPYPRIVALHLAIVLGAFAAQTFDEATWILIILVIGKIVIDLGLHFKAHQLEEPLDGDERRSIALEAAERFAKRGANR